ncbi:MAG: ABC transporter ATP-binding protein [Anaerolineae bacterium]|nr:ABC transporter ATP-binding protein [Anaerolineae bacterium]
MTEQTAPAIETRELTVTIGQFRLRDVHLRIPSGVLCAVLGAAGSGKTTLVKLLLGLEDPDAGQRLIFGHDLTRDQPQIHLGYLPQPHLLHDEMTIQEALRFTTSLVGQQHIDSAAMQNVLSTVKLTVNLHMRVSTLNISERRRLQLAKALLGEPCCLLLDDPAASLTDNARRELLDILRDVNVGRTVIYTTSIPADAIYASDYLALLHEGALIAQGATTDLIEQADNAIYHLTISGDATTVHDLLIEQAWIESIHVQRKDDLFRWTVHVNDERQAERSLLRAVLADRRLHVVDYGQARMKLRPILQQIEMAGTTARTS